MLVEFVPITFVLLVSLAGAALAQSRYPQEEGRLLLLSWGFHVVMTFAQGAVVRYVYGYGDLIGYHKRGSFVADLVWENPVSYLPEVGRAFLRMEHQLDVARYGGPSTEAMTAISGIACLLAWNSFWGSNLVFGMASYFGKLFLFESFRSRLPPALHGAALLCVMMTPSFVFWSVGLVKETIAVIGISAFVWGLSRLSRPSASVLVALLIGFTCVYSIKPFFLLVLVVSVAGTVAWRRSVKNGKLVVRPISIALSLVFGYGAMLGVGQVAPEFAFDKLVDATVSQQETALYGGSSYALTTGTDLRSQLLATPLALLAGWFRPSLLDVRNPQMLVNALETTAILWLFLRGFYTRGFRIWFDQLKRSPDLVFCWIFATGVGLGTGLASGNLGTLSRYRAPLVPFLLIALIVLNAEQPYRATRRRATSPARSPAPVGAGIQKR